MTLEAASTNYPGMNESIQSARNNKHLKGNHSIMPISNQSPLARRAANQRKIAMQRQNQSLTTRISENIKKEKFITTKDAEAEKIRLRNEEVQKKRNNTSAEPFWNDFNP